MTNTVEETEQAKEKILDCYANVNESDFWKTPEYLSNETEIPLVDVLKILEDGDFFQSQNSEGAPVFTTKDNFRQFQSFGKKLWGAFRNRID